MVILLLGVLKQIPSLSAPNDDCPESDLNTPKDSPFRSIPIYDQDGSRTCYAYAAVQLLDYWRLQHGAKPTDLVNPVYAAWVETYQNRSWITRIKSTKNSGFAEDVIMALRKQGYCKHDKVEACLSEFKRLGNMTDASLLHFLETIYDNYTVFTFGNSTAKAIEKTEQDRWFKNNCSVSNLSATLQARNLMGVAATKILADLFQGCQPPDSLATVPEPHLYRDRKDADIQKRIDDALTNKVPAGVILCSTVFNNPSYRGLNQSSFMLARDYSDGHIKPDCVDHNVLISGRKKIDGSCKYLVRNSWGALWHPKGVVCACTLSDGSYKAECQENEGIEFVGCWYDKKDLVPNIESVTTM